MLNSLLILTRYSRNTKIGPKTKDLNKNQRRTFNIRFCFIEGKYSFTYFIFDPAHY